MEIRMFRSLSELAANATDAQGAVPQRKLVDGLRVVVKTDRRALAAVHVFRYLPGSGQK
jgi:hypothetical protein